MSEWITKNIGDIAEIVAGGTPSTLVTEYWNGEISWITPNDLSNFKERYISYGERNITKKGLTKSSAKLLPRNTILLTTRAPVGYLAIAKNEVTTNQGFKNLICDENQVNYLYLYYYIKTNTEHFKSVASGATFPELSTTTLKQIKISLPTLKTQIRIAKILSAYDDAIENNNRRIAILEKIASEIYNEWFVRFRFPGHENTKIVNGLPEGWEIVNLGDLFEITSSKRIYLSDYVVDGIPFYRSKEIIQMSKGESLSDPLYISIEKYNEIKNRFGVPSENDILLTSVGTIGFSFLVDNRVFYFKDGNLTWLKTSISPLLALYMFYWLNSCEGKNTILSSTIGTSQSALTIEKLKSMKILKPNINILKSFFDKANDIIKLQRNLQSKNQNLIQQRELLLPRLMKGKLNV